MLHTRLVTDNTVLASDKEVLVEFVGLHAHILRRMPWVQSMLVLGMGLFIVPHVPLHLYAGWGVLTVGVEAARAFYAKRVLKRGNRIDPKREHAAFVLLAGAAGAAVGIGAIAFLPRLPTIDQALFGVILLAMPAAGVAVSQSSRYLVAAYAISILAPASITWMTIHDTQALSVLALTILHCSLIVMVATDGEKLLLRSVMIRHERELLVRDLEARNAEIRVVMAQAEQSARARERVLAAASHDLRQPLHALSIYSAVLAADPAPDMQREVAANIDQIVRSLGSLLHGMLDLSRLSAGLYVSEKQRFSLEDLVSGVCAEYERVAADKGLELQRDLTPIRLIGDSVVVGRIVRNLVNNAVKYTDQGCIRVATQLGFEDGVSAAIISVSDSGRGIPATEQSRVFEEFYQLDNPGRDRSKGVGLGLAIVQRLCEIAGARISLQSEPGEGSRFEVRFRGEHIDPECADLPPRQAELPRLIARCVYVVDDETGVLESTRQLLHIWGIRALTADSVAAAERLFDEHGAPDLMLTDLRLGGAEDGAELARRMQSAFGEFPVLIITGEVSSSTLKRVEVLGYELLHKPITADVLRSRMEVVLTAKSKCTVNHGAAGGPSEFARQNPGAAVRPRGEQSDDTGKADGFSL